MNIKFKKLNKTIVKCKKCPRLSNFVKKISVEKRKQNINEKYWGRPVTGFGDVNAKLMIIGLAPAAHGGTRTGRAFTGDKSGDFLFKSLHSEKISNQNFSNNINDGLKLKSTFITNILKCVPPGDKPKINELITCSNYFKKELDYLELFSSNEDSIKIIEWPNLIKTPLTDKLEIRFDYAKIDDEREIDFTGVGKWKNFQ